MRMTDYLSKSPYVAPSYAEMVEKCALMEGTTEGMYETSVANLAVLEGMVVSSIAYESDGLRIMGIEVLPELTAGEKIPLMIYCRGGSGDYGMLSPGQVIALMAPFARGEIRAGVLASNYRGNGGSEGKEEWGGGDVRDVLRLIEVGKNQGWWDGKNIFLLGWSRGGMMTYLTLKAGAPITAAAVGAGAADLFDGNARRPEMEKVCARFIPDFAARREAALTERSAVCWPEKLTAPLLLMHGDADDRVNVSEARALYAKLQALGKTDVRYVEYAEGNHALRKHWKEWVAEVTAWFTAYRR